MRSNGVSNFNSLQIKRSMNVATIKFVDNQIERNFNVEQS